MTTQYDVLVVGGGPAGLGAALTCSKLGLHTILVEKSNHFGIPIKTSALTWSHVLDEWIKDPKSVARKFSKIQVDFNVGTKKVLLDFGKTVGCTLNYSYFLQELASEFVMNNGKILIGANFQSPIIKRNFVCGGHVKYQSKVVDISSKLVVDASGPSAVVAKSVGNHFKHDAELGVGLEYEVTNLKNFDVDSVAFYGGIEIVPVGYGWIFPTGPKRARIGICTVLNTPEKAQGAAISRCINKFISKGSPIFDFVKNAVPLEEHGGAYLLSTPLEKPYGNGYFVVGDSASHASSLLGEGIRYALEFGKYAAITAKEAIKKNDFSSDFLSIYKKRCDEYLSETFSVADDLLTVPTDEYWKHLTERLIDLKKAGELELALRYFKTAMDYEDACKIFPNFAGKYLRRKKC